MQMPLFFNPEILSARQMTLDEDTSKHIIGVLRMKIGDSFSLTDGKGNKAKAEIVEENRKKCVVQILSTEVEEPTSNVSIAISLIKNASRFEWFLEKATEIGVREIIPLLCDRTEKDKVRFDRMNNILVSAMLQSQQCWMPRLLEPISFQKIIKKNYQEKKFVAHCLPGQKVQLSSLAHHASSIILIGPEGDFTENEINVAVENGFQPVALGNTRLRTETAGIVAATLLCNWY